MKKLISFLVALVMTVPMWAWYAYADYGYNSNNQMGLLYVGTSTNPAAGNSSWKNAKAGTSSQSGTKTIYFGAFPKLGYEFVGWYKGSTSSSANIGSNYTSNPYSASLNSATTYYARFQAITYSPSYTKNYTISGKSCTMNAYDMKTNDGIYWGDRAIGATDLRGVGLYFRYGDLTPVTSTSTSDIYTQYSADSHKYTTSGNLPADRDIATRTLGEGWRMPTKAEYTTLKGKVDFIKDERDGGYAGAKAKTAVSSKYNIIYFYYGGYYNSGSKSDAGGTYSNMGCHYWSSTNCTSYSAANTYFFKIAATSSHPWTSSISETGNYGTYYALQVKPVYDTRTNYTLTIKGGVNGSSTLKTNTGKWGATFSYTAPDIDGYTFTGWSDGNTDQERTFYTCDMTITAQYEVASTPTYTVSFDKNDDWGTLSASQIANVPSGEGITVSNNQVTINGTTITATPADATAEYTYAFDSWSNATGTITAARTITANFTRTPKNYTLTWDVNGGNALTGSYTSGSVAFGTSIDQPADPTREGYVFNGWGTTVASTMPANNLTYTAQWLATYTVTINTPEHGTLVVKDAGNNTISNGGKVASGTVLTLTATPDVANHYVFKQWKNDAAASVTVTSNVTLGVEFELEKYTIRFLMDDGKTVLSTAQVAYGDNPIEPSEPTKIATEEYTYTFTGWDPAVTAVSGAQDYRAVFSSSAVVKYNLTIGAFENGSVTLTAGGKTVTVFETGGTYQYAQGTTIIVEAVPTKGYHFTTWKDEALTTANRRIKEIAANTSITPTFVANTPFAMLDTWEEDDFKTNCAAATGVLTVTLTGRSFAAGQWATLSVPFDYTLNKDDDELYNGVYRLNTLTLSQDGGSVNFEFIRTNTITANTPYLIVPRQAVSSVVFYGVTMETPAELTITTDDRAEFVSSLWKQTMYGPNAFYVATGNSLRYAANTGTAVKGNRAFFRKIGTAATSPAPRRAIFVIDGEEREVEITDDAIEEVQNVRKYMENGVLIIERNGVRFNAQGQR